VAEVAEQFGTGGMEQVVSVQVTGESRFAQRRGRTADIAQGDRPVESGTGDGARYSSMS
jgi:hypothetical protein